MAIKERVFLIKASETDVCCPNFMTSIANLVLVLPEGVKSYALSEPFKEGPPQGRPIEKTLLATSMCGNPGF
jgi:hypothetical protein